MTGTLRTDPTQPLPGRTRRPFLPLNNKCMELRKVALGADQIRFFDRARDIIHLPTTVSCLQCTVAVLAVSSSPWSFELLLQSNSTRLDTASPAAVQPPDAELPCGAGRPFGCGHHRRRVWEAGPAGPHFGANFIHFFVALV
jgi:hypothetical protein